MTFNIRSLFSRRVKLHSNPHLHSWPNDPAALSKVSGSFHPRNLDRPHSSRWLIIQEVFPGCPQMKKGYMYLNEAPGIGVDLDEQLAAKYPFKPFPAGAGFRFPVRKADGTQIRP